MARCFLTIGSFGPLPQGLSLAKCQKYWTLCRAVLPERPLYPAYAPDNFPVVYEAARKALTLAQAAVAANPGSAVAARDLVFAQAAVTRWPDGSEIGAARDEAEIAYSDALKAYGESSGLTFAQPLSWVSASNASIKTTAC